MFCLDVKAVVLTNAQKFDGEDIEPQSGDNQIACRSKDANSAGRDNTS